MGAPRVEEHAHGVLNRLRVGSRANDRDGPIVDLAFEPGIKHLVRNLQQNGAAFAAAHGVEGAPQEIGQVVNGMRHGRPFDDRREDLCGAKRWANILALA